MCGIETNEREMEANWKEDITPDTWMLKEYVYLHNVLKEACEALEAIEK